MSIIPMERRGKNERILPTIENFTTIMLNDHQYSGVRYNEMLQSAEIHPPRGVGKIVRWSDSDDARSMQYIESTYGIYSKDKHSAALRILFDERKYNPIIDIVEAVKWDGISRCNDFLHKLSLIHI